MKTKNLLLTSLVAATIGLGGVAYAEHGYGGKGCHNKQQQSGKHYGGKHGKSVEKRVERMAKKLDLSDAQKQQVKSLMEDNKASTQPLREQIRALKQSLKQLDPAASDFSAQLNTLAGQKADLSRQMMIARGTNRQQVFALLTPEQQTKMKEMKEKRMQKRMERGE